MKPARPSKYITGEKKYFTAITLLITMIFLAGFISRVYLDKKANNWDIHQVNLSRGITEKFKEEFSERERAIIDAASLLKFLIRDHSNNGIMQTERLYSFAGEGQFDNYHIVVLDSALNVIMVNRGFIFLKGEVENLSKSDRIASSFFYENPLASYLVFSDTLITAKGKYYITIADLVNRKAFYAEGSRYTPLGEKTERSSSLKLNLSFTADAVPNPDGREFSSPILNSSGKKIGLVSFTRPGLRNYIESAGAPVSLLQSLMVVAVALLIPFAVRRDTSKIRQPSIRLALVIIYLIFLRVLIYLLEFTSHIFPEELTDPAKFASGFGLGIVKSPIDFTLTVIFFWIICLLIFRNSVKNKSIAKASAKVFIPVSFVLILSIFPLIRAYAASVKSIIFDSSIRYFKEPEIFPALPTALMNFAGLLMSISFFLIFVSILYAVYSRFHKSDKRKSLAVLILFLAVMSGLGIVFIEIQKQPLINIPIILTIILFSFILLFLTVFEKKSLLNLLWTASVFSAVTGVTLLNLFNSDLERESLKTTALEVNRRSENLIYFLLNESLLNISTSPDIKNVLNGKHTDANSAAFAAWSVSSLRKEAFNSSVTILNNKKKPLGGFVMNLAPEYVDPFVLRYLDTTNSLVVKLDSKEELSHFSGITGVYEKGELTGYVVASVEFDRDMIVNQKFPEVLRSRNIKINSVIDPQNLNIVVYEKGKTKKLQGDFYPDKEQENKIWQTNFAGFNESWQTLEFNSEKYLFYFLKTQKGGKERIISAGLKEKELSWGLFNFFKLFILQVFYIIIFYFGYLVYRNLTFTEYRHSYRSQLFISFLIIALLPLIAIAIYNRMNESKKSLQMLRTALVEKSQLLENHITQQIKSNPAKSPETIFNNAARELNTSFAVYAGGELKYSSLANLASAGILPWKLSPRVTHQLLSVGANEFFTGDNILGESSYSLYKKINLSGTDYIVSINESLNPVNVVVTVLEIDVFVIGIYSFAVVIIILLSGLLSNRISQPIAKLTKATKSIAHGDLNVNLDIKQKGEIGELIEGFKFMTGEIRRNQKELAEQEREMAWREIAKQVAHEIKNPLTPMKLSIQQLIASHQDKAPDFDEIFNKITATVLNQVDILSQIANEFSRFAKMPSAKLEKIDLLPVIRDVLVLYTDEKVKLTFNTKKKKALIMGDTSQLRRMMINFIRNSIQAGAKKIQFELTSNEEFFDLIIADDGAGIPEEVKGKIFNKNFTTKPGGMGLGLKLSKRFIESLGGRLQLEPGGDWKTVFKVTLPQIL